MYLQRAPQVFWVAATDDRELRLNASMAEVFGGIISDLTIVCAVSNSTRVPGIYILKYVWRLAVITKCSEVEKTKACETSLHLDILMGNVEVGSALSSYHRSGFSEYGVTNQLQSLLPSTAGEKCTFLSLYMAIDIRYNRWLALPHAMMYLQGAIGCAKSMSGLAHFYHLIKSQALTRYRCGLVAARIL